MRPISIIFGLGLIAEALYAGHFSLQLMAGGIMGGLGALGSLGLCWAGLVLTGLLTDGPRVAAIATLVCGSVIPLGMFGWWTLATGLSGTDCHRNELACTAIWAVPLVLGVFNLACVFLLWRLGRPGSAPS